MPELAPAGTVTVAGNVIKEPLGLADSCTTRLPSDAGLLNVIVPIEAAPLVTEVGNIVIEDIVGKETQQY